MDFPKKQQQCLIPKYLLQYLTSLQTSHNDPTAPWGGGGGGSYTAGDGIDITNDVISIDNTVALKTDIPSLTGYATETWVTNQGYLIQSDLASYITSTDLATELLDYAELSDLATVATTGSYNDLLNKPTIPDAVSGTNDGTNWTSLTIGSDTYGLASGSTPTNMVTTDTVQTISGAKTFTGLTTFKGTYYDVYFGQSSGFSVSDKNNPAQEQMSIYPGFISSYRDTGNTTLDGRFRLGNHEFTAYNSDTEYKIKLVSKGGVTTYGEYTFKNKTGDVAITSEIPTATSDLTNDSGYITSSALTGYATESWVTNQGYLVQSDLSGYVTSTDLAAELLDYAELSDLATVATTGDYDDLSNKPTIPDAVSGTNDGTNWTSITIGSDTYGIPSGGGGGGSSLAPQIYNFTAADWSGLTTSNSYIISTAMTREGLDLSTLTPGQTVKIDCVFVRPSNGTSYVHQFTLVIPDGDMATESTDTFQIPGTSQTNLQIEAWMQISNNRIGLYWSNTNQRRFISKVKVYPANA